MKRFLEYFPLYLYFLLLTVLLQSELLVGGAEEEKGIYLVLVEGEPVAFFRGAAAPKEHENLDLERESQKMQAKSLVEFHDQLLETNLDNGTYKKLYSFHHIVNGFAVHTTRSQATRLKSAPSVLHVEKDVGVKPMTTYTPQLLGLPEAVWSEEGGKEHAGEGVVIGVIDTGIDPTHPSFAYDPQLGQEVRKGSPFPGSSCDVGPRFPASSCNGKIVSAKYFVAGAAAAHAMDVSDLSPFDEVGHGSHVASIAAGNWGVPVVVDGFYYGRASGMAPRARLAIYKALYPEGSTFADVISAVDQAAQDKVDVLVLSLGPEEIPEDTVSFMTAFDISLLFARRSGIFVVQAAGNNGPGEATVLSFSPWTMGVAASTTGRSYDTSLVIGNGTRLRGVGLSGGSGVLPYKLVSARDAAAGNGSSTNPLPPRAADECQYAGALQPAKVAGRIVICSFSGGFSRGTSTVSALLDTARSLGFAGFVLVADPLYGDFVAEPIPFPLPGVLIPRASDAKILWEYYERSTRRRNTRGGAVTLFGGTASIEEGRIAAFDGHAAAPVVSRFSSRGPDVTDNRKSPADVLKPDVLAPGGQVWAAWSPASALEPALSGRSFALLSGTSMAAPHVAGVAALVRRRHPAWAPSAVASAISTAASKHDGRGLALMAQGGGRLGSVYPSTPFDHGAGFINPAGALNPGLVLPTEFEDYVSFLCSLPGLVPAQVQAVTGTACNASLPTPADLNLPSITVSSLVGARSIRRTVKNVASRPEKYTCSALPPEGVGVEVQPSWFAIAPDGTQDLVIKLNVSSSRVSDGFRFGEIVLVGSLDHIVRLPLSVQPSAFP